MGKGRLWDPHMTGGSLTAVRLSKHHLRMAAVHMSLCFNVQERATRALGPSRVAINTVPYLLTFALSYCARFVFSLELKSFGS